MTGCYLYLNVNNVDFNSVFGHMLREDLIYPLEVRFRLLVGVAKRCDLDYNRYNENIPERLEVYGNKQDCVRFIRHLYPSVKDFHVDVMPWEDAQDLLHNIIRSMNIDPNDYQIIFLHTSAIVALRHKKDAVMIKLSVEC